MCLLFFLSCGLGYGFGLFGFLPVPFAHKFALIAASSSYISARRALVLAVVAHCARSGLSSRISAPSGGVFRINASSAGHESSRPTSSGP